MANPIAAVAKVGAFRTAGSFDTFSSFGVSLNSSLSNNAIGLGKNILSQVVSDAIFSKGSFSLQGKPTVGMVNGDGTQLDPKYRVSIISSKLNKVVTGYLQDRTQIRVSSDWQPFIQFGQDSISQGIEKVLQSTGHSLQNMALSRRMWAGTSPISMSLNLVFEAITDAMSEVVSPCKALLQIASPSRYGSFNVDAAVGAFKSNITSGITSAVGAAIKAADISVRENEDGFFLAPPGPYPFKSDTDLGDTISIYIGEYLSFSPVIISKADVDFDTRIDYNGNPISAKATVNFETYQVFGKQDIDRAFTAAAKSKYVLREAKKLAANFAGFV